MKEDLDIPHSTAYKYIGELEEMGILTRHEDIRVFVERQGIPKLAAALHYTLRVVNGEMTQRTAANKLAVHHVEGTTVVTALQDVVEEATAYDPHLEP